MRKLNVNFNYTNRPHLVLVVRIYFEKNLNYPKVQLARIQSSKKYFHKFPIQRVCLKLSTISNTAGNMKIFVILFLFSFKL